MAGEEAAAFASRLLDPFAKGAVTDMESDRCNLQYLKGVGEKRARLFQRLGVADVGALCRLYPRRYKDWSSPVTIAGAAVGEICCVKAAISLPVTEHRARRGMTLYKTLAADGSGVPLYITIFNNKYAAARLTQGKTFLFYGRVDGNLLRREMVSPEIEEEGCAAIHPVYPATEGLSSKTIEKIMPGALRAFEPEDPLPQEMRNRLGLLDLNRALWNIHFPKSRKALECARRRLIFEELFLLQTGLKQLKTRDRGTTSARIRTDRSAAFAAMLPFALTGAQRRVIGECVSDMRAAQPMNRLVQGDVGSGKTAVAASLAMTAAANGLQTAMMAPTEILAEQHYRSLSALLKGSGFRIALLTGSATKKEKERIKSLLAAGEVDLVAGTHALLTQDVRFAALGLVITDEQHRFGVAQRAALAAKGDHPHLLVMSATPIPRTLALIVYGDLDISVIDELPPGRQPIETYAVSTALRERAYAYVRQHLDAGRQGYVVCPLIEENEEGISGLVPAVEYEKTLSDGPFAGYRLGLLHGRMKPAEKDAVMRRFSAGEIQLLISTTVIEVGVDVPNAVIMVIENADRFGLSQLHQLRGRIGRGKHKSTCILISDAKGEEAVRRLTIMKETSDGFKIADEDLKLRGPGDFFGRRQHGLPELRLADFATDMKVLRAAGEEAERLLAADPELSRPEHMILKQAVREMFSSSDGQALN